MSTRVCVTIMEKRCQPSHSVCVFLFAILRVWLVTGALWDVRKEDNFDLTVLSSAKNEHRNKCEHTSSNVHEAPRIRKQKQLSGSTTQIIFSTKAVSCVWLLFRIASVSFTRTAAHLKAFFWSPRCHKRRRKRLCCDQAEVQTSSLHLWTFKLICYTEYLYLN